MADQDAAHVKEVTKLLLPYRPVTRESIDEVQALTQVTLKLHPIAKDETQVLAVAAAIVPPHLLDTVVESSKTVKELFQRLRPLLGDNSTEQSRYEEWQQLRLTPDGDVGQHMLAFSRAMSRIHRELDAGEIKAVFLSTLPSFVKPRMEQVGVSSDNISGVEMWRLLQAALPPIWRELVPTVAQLVNAVTPPSALATPPSHLVAALERLHVEGTADTYEPMAAAVYGQVRCYNCQRFGHMAKDCRSNSKGKGRGGKSNNSRSSSSSSHAKGAQGQ
jgi:hypothetical protein